MSYKRLRTQFREEREIEAQEILEEVRGGETMETFSIRDPRGKRSMSEDKRRLTGREEGPCKPPCTAASVFLATTEY